MRGRARQSAFTLLELLVALALTVTLTSSLYVCFRTAFKSQDHAEAAMTPARTALYALELMRLDLESAMVPNNVLAGPFEGTPAGETPAVIRPEREPGHRRHDHEHRQRQRRHAHVLLLRGRSRRAPISRRRRPPGRRRTRTARRRSPATSAWSRTRSCSSRTTPPASFLSSSGASPPNLLAQEAPPPELDNLCDNVLALNFQYFDGTNWWPNWDSTQEDSTLPTAVQVTLQLRPPVVGQPDPNNPPLPYVVVRIFQPQCGPTTVGNSVEGLPSEASTP